MADLLADVTRVAEIDNDIADLEALIATCKAERAILEERLKKGFQEDKIGSTRAKGRTVYLKRSIYARPQDGTGRAAVCAVLETIADASGFVEPNYNANTVSAWIRNDLPRDGDDLPVLPGALKRVLRVDEEFKIATRKAN